LNITLNCAELEEAVIDYVNKLGVNTKGKEISIYIEKDFAKATASVSIRKPKE
jgi:hypothetical protein